MLAVLVLAAITAISFSLATIVFIELRASRDVVRGEPALYATLGVTEEAMFQYKRFINQEGSLGQSSFDVPTCTSSKDIKDVCVIGGVTLTMPGNQPLTEDDVPRLETVYAGQTKVIPMYQLGSWSLQYSSVELELVPIGSTSSLNTSLRWTDQDGNTGEDMIGVLTEGGGSVSSSSIFNNRQYELVLQNNSSGENLLVSITTYSPLNEDLKGLPFIAQRVLKVVADYAGLTRVYKVFIPVP